VAYSWVGYVLPWFDLEDEPFGVRRKCAEAEDDTPDDPVVVSGERLGMWP